MYRGVLKLVAIAVPVLLLVGIGMSLVTRWREAAHRARCQNNLRQLGWFAMWSYADEKTAFPDGRNAANGPMMLPEDARPGLDREFPTGTVFNASLPPERRLSWQVTLLPFLGQDRADVKFDLTKAWDQDDNAAAAATFVQVLACPSQFDRATPALTPYIGMAGLGRDAPRLPAKDARAGFLRYDDPTKVRMLERGLSRTIAILETGRERGPWAAGGPPTVRGLDPADAPSYIGPNRPFGGHVEGTNAAFADGSVRFQSWKISPDVLEKLVTLREYAEP